MAGHRHHTPLLAQPLHHGALLLRQHLGLDLGDPEPLRDRLGGGAIVAREHDDAHALHVQRREGRRRRRLDRIGDGDQPHDLAIARDVHHRPVG
jgi:hypothetical protein